MISKAILRLLHVIEHIQINGVISFFKETMFLNRRTILVEKKLLEVTERLGPFKNANLKLVDLNAETLSSGFYRFAIKHRGLKAAHYISQGFSGHAIARDNLILGEIWYYTSKSTNDASTLHKDLQWLGFKSWSKENIYSFDIFVAPTERKNGISAALQNNAMFSLRSKGYLKAFAYYWADNIPAVWNTKVINKWQELEELQISRFLIWKKVKHVGKIQLKK